MPNNYAFDVTASDLQVQVFGYNATTGITSLQLDDTGNLLVAGSLAIPGGVSISGVATTSTFTVVAGGQGTILAIDTSQQKTYSYYFFNASGGTATVQLQIAPIDSDAYYTADSAAITVATGNKAVLSTKYYLDFTRLIYNTGTFTGSCTVYYNSQV